MPQKIKNLPHSRHYFQKIAANIVAGSLVLLFSSLIGTLGYRYFFSLGWVDSFYNASMILTGMGPVNAAPSAAAKIFASFYAIYSGVAFLTCVAIVLSPVVHRFLHKFHLDIEE